MKNTSDIILLDLFSGTGGFAKGFINTGFRIKEHYFSEVDKYAIANYNYNFKDAKNIGDITQAKGSKIKRPNIITFGSPCQDISIAGKQAGLKGKRSRLFFEAIRLIRECRPDVFIFENVKGLFSSNQGKDFEVVLKAFADLGVYDIQWQLLNTKWFLPQNRERVYFVGFLRGQSRPQIFPIGEGHQRHHALDKEEPQRKTVSPTIDTKVGDNTHRSPYVLHWKGSVKKWNVDKMQTSPTLNTQQDWVRNPLILEKKKKQKKQQSKKFLFHVPEATRKGYATATEGDSINLSFLEANLRRGRVGKGTANTIDTSVNQYTLMKGNLRRLTPVECERLQGFPDDWTKSGLVDGLKIEISDAQRYKLLGNAVSVAVVQAIAQRLLGKAQTQIDPPQNDKVALLTLELQLELSHFKKAA
ncbi:MAG: DNA cytosine methyltransferase [Bacteroidia bacterium]|nr:DNA cytosine methyltransferase [Bacteroidia bacterium]